MLATVLTLAAAVAHGQSRSPAGADPVIGSQLFTNLCGFCHQDGGRVAGRGPKLAGTDRPDEYILNRIRTGKEGACQPTVVRFPMFRCARSSPTSAA